jgi:hypothetical protein
MGRLGLVLSLLPACGFALPQRGGNRLRSEARQDLFDHLEDRGHSADHDRLQSLWTAVSQRHLVSAA